MNYYLDQLFTNEYFFTFFCTFLSIFIKGMSTKHESWKSVLHEESYDLGPELVLISLSFAVSILTKLYEQNLPRPYIDLMHWLILCMFVLIIFIVLLKRLSSNTTQKVKTMWIPLFLGFLSLYVVLSYSFNIQG